MSVLASARGVLMPVLRVTGLSAMQIQNLAALAAAASVTQNPASAGSALTTSSSPLSVLTSSGELHMFSANCLCPCRASV